MFLFLLRISSEDGSVSTTTPRSLGYPNVWVINLAGQNWTASGEVGYAVDLDTSIISSLAKHLQSGVERV